ncbi:hypothetical protein HMPREF9956_2247 [Staphylococcus epidermidis 14.1.R1.SE]|nr:hypothetical protein HMPREF9956_2247 [Staphylococcus epidermidis 14.1.R1.SE]
MGNDLFGYLMADILVSSYLMMIVCFYCHMYRKTYHPFYLL